MVITQRQWETNSTLLYRLSSSSEFGVWLLTIIFVALVLLPGWTGPACGDESREDSHFPALRARLVDDGFARTLVDNLYASPEVSFDQRVVSVYFLHREGKLNYDQFLSRSSIDMTVEYFKKHEKTLKRVEREYGVDAEVICAIILVETRFGKVVGTRLVINTLSTLADLDEESTRDRIWNTHLKSRTKVSRKQFDAWASRKSAWAYGELKAYLEYVSTHEMDPLAIHGSFAGAMGISQFIPSSVLQYAQDGNKDGQINLFHHEDAIESIANYLKQHGWRPLLTRQEAFEIILKYNNSRYYAETILDVAERVEARRKEMSAALGRAAAE